MYAFKGDRIYVRDDAAETMREAEVIEVEHVAGHPPYWVRWADTDELELWFPEADVVIEHSGPSYPAEYEPQRVAVRS